MELVVVYLFEQVIWAIVSDLLANPAPFSDFEPVPVVEPSRPVAILLLGFVPGAVVGAGSPEVVDHSLG